MAKMTYKNIEYASLGHISQKFTTMTKTNFYTRLSRISKHCKTKDEAITHVINGTHPMQSNDHATCQHCNTSKPREKFRKHNRTSSGITNTCTDCHKIKINNPKPKAKKNTTIRHTKILAIKRYRTEHHHINALQR